MSFNNEKSVKQITSESKLRKIIPAYPKVLDKRIIPSLDQYCLEIIENSSFAVFGCSDSRIPMTILLRSSIEVINSKTLLLHLDTGSSSACESVHTSLYFLVPGVGHGLRVNGKLQRDQSGVRLNIVGAYVHCARAAARSMLWTANCADHLSTRITTGSSYEEFLKESSFLLLKTMNQHNLTELSPRGDHPNFVQMIDSTSLFIPERPGNKVAVSLRNILQNEAIELLLIVPGSNLIMTVSGKARLTTEDILLDRATVNKKRPKLGIFMVCCQFSIQNCEAFSQSTPWRETTHQFGKPLTKFPKVLSVHMNGEGVLGKATTPIVQAIVKHDMKHLY